MTAFPRLRRLGAPIASAFATAAVFTGAFWMQHARGAWPFVPGSQTVVPLMSSAIPSPVGTTFKQERVPVDVNPATVQEREGVRGRGS